MVFDPAKAREERKKSGDGEYGVPPGDYLLAIVEFDRNRNKKNTAWYLRSKIKVIAGRGKGKTWKENISLDFTNNIVAMRFGLLIDAIGQTEAFDETSESDLRTVLLHKPFKAKVRRYTENDFTTNAIERYLLDDKVTESDRDAMEQYKIEREAARSAGGGGDDGPPIDDVPHAADDGDIPF